MDLVCSIIDRCDPGIAPYLLDPIFLEMAIAAQDLFTASENFVMLYECTPSLFLSMMGEALADTLTACQRGQTASQPPEKRNRRRIPQRLLSV